MPAFATSAPTQIAGQSERPHSSMAARAMPVGGPHCRDLLRDERESESQFRGHDVRRGHHESDSS